MMMMICEPVRSTDPRPPVGLHGFRIVEALRDVSGSARVQERRLLLHRRHLCLDEVRVQDADPQPERLGHSQGQFLSVMSRFSWLWAK